MTQPEKLPKNPLGPTGETVRANVKRLREAQNLTFAELSRNLAVINRPIPVLGLRRIEAGERRVDADDLLALAVVLKVNPNALLFPPVLADGTLAIVTGTKFLPTHIIWGWADGEQPLWPWDLTGPKGDGTAPGENVMEYARRVFRLRAQPKGFIEPGTPNVGNLLGLNPTITLIGSKVKLASGRTGIVVEEEVGKVLVDGEYARIADIVEVLGRERIAPTTDHEMADGDS